MKLSRAIRRSAALALVPALLLAGVGPAGTFVFCHPMQEVMITSCCPVEEQPDRAYSQIESTACCERFTVEPSIIPSDTAQRHSHQLASPPLAVLASAQVDLARRLVPAVLATNGWSNIGPPLLHVTQSLLI